MTASLKDLRDLPDWPLMLSAAQAAAYVGLSHDGFRSAVARGIYPAGIRGPFGRRILWHRHALDRAAARVADLPPNGEEPSISDEEWAAWSPSATTGSRARTEAKLRKLTARKRPKARRASFIKKI